MILVISIALSVAAYAVFAVYDVANIRRPGLRGSSALFFLGLALVVISAAVLVAGSLQLFALSARCIIALVLAAAFLVAEVWALFFSLPKGTYTEPGCKRPVYEGGAYSLCRHPGVFFYCCFFICLFAALPSWQTAVGFGVLCAGDIFYMLLQDMWTFPKLLEGYGDYKRRTTMFFPQFGGLRKCTSGGSI